MSEFLPYIMDAAVIFVFVFYLVKGWKKGLLRMLVTMLSWLIALILAWQLYGYVADFLRAIGVQAWLANSFGANVEVPAQPGIAEAAGYIESLFLPDALKTSMIGNNNYEAYSALGVNSFGDYIGVFLANIVVNALALLIVFIAAFILLKLIGRSLSAVNRIPLVGLANRVLGLIAGAVMGYCILQVAMFILTMLATGQNVFSTVMIAVEESTVAAWFFHSNHLIDWIMKIFV